MALMLLADRWARTRGGRAWGLTVDHGLRSESADEARIVASWLGAREIPHEILRWAGAKPASGIQEAAREARYRLLTGLVPRPLLPAPARGASSRGSDRNASDPPPRRQRRRRAGRNVGGARTAGLPLGATAPRRKPPPPRRSPRGRGAAFPARPEQPEPGLRARPPPADVHRAIPLSPMGGEGCGEGATSRVAAGTLTRLARTRTSHPRIKSGAGSLPQCGRGAERSRPRGAFADMHACARERIAREQALDALSARALALHPAGFGVLDPAVLAAADPETAARLLSRVVSCLGGSRYPARAERLGRTAHGAGGGAAACPHARRLPFRPVARPVAGPARTGRGRGSDRARTGRRFALGPALCRLALGGSDRRGHDRLPWAARRRAAGGRFRRGFCRL